MRWELQVRALLYSIHPRYDERNDLPATRSRAARVTSGIRGASAEPARRRLELDPKSTDNRPPRTAIRERGRMRTDGDVHREARIRYAAAPRERERGSRYARLAAQMLN